MASTSLSGAPAADASRLATSRKAASFRTPETARGQRQSRRQDKTRQRLGVQAAAGREGARRPREASPGRRREGISCSSSDCGARAAHCRPDRPQPATSARALPWRASACATCPRRGKAAALAQGSAGAPFISASSVALACPPQICSSRVASGEQNCRKPSHLRIGKCRDVCRPPDGLPPEPRGSGTVCLAPTCSRRASGRTGPTAHSGSAVRTSGTRGAGRGRGALAHGRPGHRDRALQQGACSHDGAIRRRRSRAFGAGQVHSICLELPFRNTLPGHLGAGPGRCTRSCGLNRDGGGAIGRPGRGRRRGSLELSLASCSVSACGRRRSGQQPLRRVPAPARARGQGIPRRLRAGGVAQAAEGPRGGEQARDVEASPE